MPSKEYGVDWRRRSHDAAEWEAGDIPKRCLDRAFGRPAQRVPEPPADPDALRRISTDSLALTRHGSRTVSA